jgi:ERCC4-type nuclease
MNLKFNPESKVTEYQHGSRYYKNEGQPIEVDPRMAKAMLRHVHEVTPKQFVPIFLVAGDQDKPRTKAATAELLSGYPGEFPHADALVKAGYSFEAVRAVGKDDLVKLDGIGPKYADAIMAALKEHN